LLLVSFAFILGIEEQRVQEYESTDYQCASFVEVLEVSAALCVEFENAFVKVDFQGIEEGRKVIEKFKSKRKERKQVTTRVET
jgi:hypothetical protein